MSKHIYNGLINSENLRKHKSGGTTRVMLMFRLLVVNYLKFIAKYIRGIREFL